jgi:hypothetical protein
MAILNIDTVASDRRTMLESLDLEAAQFRGGTLKERITVINPNGGVRTEVRDIEIVQTVSSPDRPSALADLPARR